MDFRQLMREERQRARKERAAAKENIDNSNKSEHGRPDAAPSPVKHSAADADMGATLRVWTQRSELNIERYLVGDIPRVYYIPEWISEDEEKSILERVYAIPDEDDNVWVRLKHRRLQMWGGEVKAPFRPSPLPKWLLQIIQSLVDAKVFSEEHRPNHALINGESFVLNWHSVLISSFSADGWVFTLRAEYGVGEGIMPHEDGPSYFPFVAIISTGADSDVTFEPHRKLQQRDAFDGMATSSEANRAASPQPVLAGKFRFPLERRSLLLFTEEAYTKYLHSIDGVQSGKRVSLTIRHVRL